MALEYNHSILCPRSHALAWECISASSVPSVVNIHHCQPGTPDSTANSPPIYWWVMALEYNHSILCPRSHALAWECISALTVTSVVNIHHCQVGTPDSTAIALVPTLPRGNEKNITIIPLHRLRIHILPLLSHMTEYYQRHNRHNTYRRERYPYMILRIICIPQ